LSARLPVFVSDFLSGTSRHELDMVQLETVCRRTRVLPPIEVVAGVAIRPFRSLIFGSACYLVAKNAAKALLDHPKLLDQPIALAMFRPYTGPSKTLRHGLADPALCIQ